MATYLELYNAPMGGLDKQIYIALAIKANVIAKLATPTAEQRNFAITALKDPSAYLLVVRNYILADYNTATIAAITSATDVQVQTAVDAAVNTLLGV